MSPFDDPDESESEEELRPEEYEIPERLKSDDPASIQCPECNREVSELSDRCNHCGFYITPNRPSRLPTWLIIGAIVAISLIVASWVFRR